jgi:nucleoside permease NupC
MGHQIIVRDLVHGHMAVPICLSFFLSLSAWFFFKIMNISGTEAVVASASPWVGLGESACLVKPYIDLMTTSELHLAMTSGSFPFHHCESGVRSLIEI